MLAGRPQLRLEGMLELIISRRIQAGAYNLTNGRPQLRLEGMLGDMQRELLVEATGGRNCGWKAC